MSRIKLGNVRTPIDYLKQLFAPAGYGLGVQNGHDCTDCNEAVMNGTYYLFGESAKNHPGHSMQYGCMDVKRRGSYITQIVHYDYYEAKRFSKDGGANWGEWEWVNPPMITGNEYRTTERRHGKVIYTKTMDTGNLPNATSMVVPHYCSVIQMIRCCGTTNLGTTIPYRWNDTYLTVSADRTSIHICTNADFSTQTSTIQLWYTKD